MIGLMRIKNEARWIERSISSILPLCERVVILDDHSDDGTPDICARLPRVTVIGSPFTGLNETRDKNFLLAQARAADWMIMIDGDEILEPSAEAEIATAIAKPARCLSLRILFAWDTEKQVRIDGVYGSFWRPSIFRPGQYKFEATSAGGNFHCGNAPLELQSSARPLEAGLLHLGYLHQADRLRKFEWYNQQDPNNSNEDGYRHMVVGDLFPPESRFRHGGPLMLEAR